MKHLSLCLLVLHFAVLLTCTLFAQDWQMQNSSYPANVVVVNFSAVNDQVCWAVGQIDPGNTTPYAGFVRTTDGGNSWVCDTIPGITDGYFQEIFAVDVDTAYVTVYVLSGQSSKGIYKTTDGGTTWTRQTAYNTSLYGPGYIHFFDAQNGVVIGDPNLETYTTINGGLIWNQVTMPGALSGETSFLGDSRIASSGDNVWFATNRRLFKSTDKGGSWSVLLNETQYYDWAPSIAFQNSQTGIYALRMGGNATDHIVRRTTDGGATWNTLSHPVLDNLAPSCIQYIAGTNSTYVMVGGRASTMRGTAVTYDAGETWTLRDTLGFYTMVFASDVVGWGAQFAGNVIYKYVGLPLPVEQETTVPIGFALEQNYPNPFNPSTTIRYELPASTEVTITVHDLLGREVAVLVSEAKAPGRYEARFDASGLASGVYVYRLSAGKHVASRTMLLMK